MLHLSCLLKKWKLIHLEILIDTLFSMDVIHLEHLGAKSIKMYEILIGTLFSMDVIYLLCPANH